MIKRSSLLVYVLIALIVLTFLISPSQEKLATAQGGTEGVPMDRVEKIVYSGYVTQGNFKKQTIFIADPDGNNAVRLTKDQQDSMIPVLSPDGQSIAVFTSPTQTSSNLFIIDSKGGNQRQLIRGQSKIVSPAWSPDSKQLVYGAVGAKGLGLYLLSIDTGKSTKLDIPNPPFTGIRGRASWSPNGKHILFTGTTKRVPTLYQVDSDGANLKKFLVENLLADNPEWSPDGQHVAFIGYEPAGSSLGMFVAVANVDGSLNTRMRQVIPTGSFDAITHPTWSPDGKRIAFGYFKARSSGITNEIFAVDVTDLESADLNTIQPVLADGMNPSWGLIPSSLAIVPTPSRTPIPTRTPRPKP